MMISVDAGDLANLVALAEDRKEALDSTVATLKEHGGDDAFYRMNEKLKAVEAEKEALFQRVVEEESKLSSACQNHERYRAEAEDWIKARDASLSDYKGRVGELEAILKETTGELERRKASLEMTASIQRKLEDELAAERAKMVLDAETHEATKAELERVQEALKLEIERGDKDRADYKIRCSNYDKGIDAQLSELAAAAKARDRYERQRNEAREVGANVEAQLRDAIKAKELLKIQRDKAWGELKDLRAVVKEQASKLTNLDKANQAALARLQAQRDKARAELEDQAAKLANAEDELARTRGAQDQRVVEILALGREVQDDLNAEKAARAVAEAELFKARELIESMQAEGAEGAQTKPEAGKSNGAA